MKILIDNSTKVVNQKLKLFPKLIGGQLLTPLTEYRNSGEVFAIDNGAYSGFEMEKFKRLLNRNFKHKGKCLFITVPDVVGSGIRTLEIFKIIKDQFIQWPLAFVAQDGMESLEIPWDSLQAIFIGGRDPWKDSSHALDIVRTAKILGKHVHVGRVNAIKRYRLFSELGADTCDGSGIARYDHMLDKLSHALGQAELPTLFDNEIQSAN